MTGFFDFVLLIFLQSKIVSRKRVHAEKIGQVIELTRFLRRSLVFCEWISQTSILYRTECPRVQWEYNSRRSSAGWSIYFVRNPATWSYVKGTSAIMTASHDVSFIELTKVFWTPLKVNATLLLQCANDYESRMVLCLRSLFLVYHPSFITHRWTATDTTGHNQQIVSTVSHALCKCNISARLRTWQNFLISQQSLYRSVNWIIIDSRLKLAPTVHLWFL